MAMCIYKTGTNNAFKPLCLVRRYGMRWMYIEHSTAIVCFYYGARRQEPVAVMDLVGSKKVAHCAAK
jgi:hypothetical protein